MISHGRCFPERRCSVPACEAKKRDGLARSGVFTSSDITLTFPAAVDTDTLFPLLASQRHANVPLSAPPEFAARYLVQADGQQPVPIHLSVPPEAQSGDCVMAANWHTALADPRSCVEWLVCLKEQVPPDTLWYAPAAALPSNVHLLCYTGFGLFDFRGVDLRAARGLMCLPEGEFPASLMQSGACTCEGCRTGDLRVHNRTALLQEIAKVRWHIEHGQIRELVEARCRLDAAQVAILRFMDQRYSFLEKSVPVARAGALRANSAESMNRVEVKRFAERVTGRYIPPVADVAVLLPCSARKPYSGSRTHRRFAPAIRQRAHELIVTSPLGLVPRDLELAYPAMHYDAPVTGYWDREERAILAGVLRRYFEKNSYRRVIAHLEGGALQVAQEAADACGITLERTCTDRRPASDEALAALDRALDGERKVRADILHGMCSWQFGADIDTKGILMKGRYPDLAFTRNRAIFFGIDRGTGLIRPTFEGWNLIPTGYRVYIDDFIPEGDVLAPGVTASDPVIREGDEVLVIGERALATGRAAMGADEMQRSRRGVAVRVRKVKRL
jgi:archaeosine synthase